MRECTEQYVESQFISRILLGFARPEGQNGQYKREIIGGYIKVRNFLLMSLEPTRYIIIRDPAGETLILKNIL